MTKPDTKPTFRRYLQDLERRVSRSERARAMPTVRRGIANTSGFPGWPVHIATPSSTGYYTLSASMTNLAYFTSAPYGSFWLMAGAAGSAATLRLIYPYDSNRILAATAASTSDPRFGYVYLVAFEDDSMLDAATTVAESTIAFAASSSNTGTTPSIRILASGWGTPNVS